MVIESKRAPVTGRQKNFKMLYVDFYIKIYLRLIQEDILEVGYPRFI